MGTKRPLDFIPDPLPAWRTTLPLVGCATAGLLAWISLYVPSTTRAGEPVPAATVASGAVPTIAAASIAPASMLPAALSEREEPVDDRAPAPSEREEPADDRAPAPPEADARATKTVAAPLDAAALERAERAAARLRAAVREGRVAAIDGAFAWIDAGERAWEDAAAVCRDADVDGVRHWSLASRDALQQLARAGKLPAGVYWTRAHARDPDAAYAYDTRRRRAVVWLKQEPNGGVVCTVPRPLSAG